MRMIIDNPSLATEVKLYAFLPQGKIFIQKLFQEISKNKKNSKKFKKSCSKYTKFIIWFFFSKSKFKKKSKKKINFSYFFLTFFPGFSFRNVFPNEVPKQPNHLIRDIGTVSSESDTTLEFGVTTISKENSQKILEKYSNVPLQIQIHYTKKDKSKLIKILSCVVKVTNDRLLAESESNVSVLSLNAVQQSAKTAQRGDYQIARNMLLSTIKVNEFSKIFQGKV